MVNILAIDRDQATLAHIRSLFERIGFQIVCVADPDGGLRRVDSIGPDLVIADIRIAAKDGIEVVKELQRRATPTKVIGLTGSGLLHAEEFEAVVNQLGIERLLVKPVDDGMLLRAAFELIPMGKIRPADNSTRKPIGAYPARRQFSRFSPLLASH